MSRTTELESVNELGQIALLNYSLLENKLARARIKKLATAMPALLESGLSIARYGDLPSWQQALDDLPDLSVSSTVLNKSIIEIEASDINSKQVALLTGALKNLHPWRKGPYKIAGVHIDTEWRSDMKWSRLVSHVEPLAGRRVLDVGCGSGYHCWRMRGEGAELVVGIDPSPLFVMQYWALQKYIRDTRVWVLPARMESLPAKMEAFDTVFSMGVLYHRRSPFDHLLELRDALVQGGQLVLETLVIAGNEGDVLVPEGRYGKMGNVWFIPSAKTLIQWLKKMRFTSIELVDESITTIKEQRATEWMTFQSLADFLDPQDLSKTVEGHPAPRRAIVTAFK